MPSSLDAEALVIVRPECSGLGDLIVEPFKPNHKHRCRLGETRLWQVRVPWDRMITKWVRKKRHVRQRESLYERAGQVPHPQAGKVIATLSAERLYGIAPGTPILIQYQGKWISAKVGHYEGWKPQDERHRNRAKHREHLQRQRQAHLDAAPERLAREKARRRARIPSRYQRLINDDPWLG